MKKIHTQNGFTLPELLMSTALLVVILSGVLITYFRCMELNEVSSNTSIAVLAAKSKLAEIEGTTYSQISGSYDNVSFSVSDLNGMGITYVDEAVPGILTITTVVSWRQKNGRLFGEDTNLNGQLNAGEDLNNNGRLDSIVEFETQKFNS